MLSNPELPENFYSLAPQSRLPGFSVIDGTVHNFSRWQEDHSEVLIDFQELGMMAYSLKPLEVAPHSADQLLPPWLEYVRSNELWGPQGKWTRFHERLQRIFETHKLLQNSETGFYSLTLNAEKLEKFGIFGTKTPTSYDLNLSWTFSLSDLEKIEKIVPQEF
jgi:hypothetical protein